MLPQIGDEGQEKLQAARVLVVGQDPSTNELLAHRIFVGRSGQRVTTLNVAVFAAPSTATRLWKKLSVASYFFTYSINAGT